MFYLIDKPINLTSFDVVKILKKKLNNKKIGHTGTLDPLASGLLLVAVGNYTKLIPYIENKSKVYEFTVGLDGTTESFDLEKDVIYLSDEKQKYFKENLKKEDLEKILKEKFTGEILQVPPKYSAIKINGKRAFEKARNKEEFEMKKRKITIFSIEILSYNYPDLVLKAHVSAGTYIRSIAADLGEMLQTGGYIKTLRRTKIGNLELNESISIDEISKEKNLDDSILFPSDSFINLKDKDIEKLRKGQFITTPLNLEKNKDYFVLQNGKIVAVVKYENNLIKPVRNI